MPESAAFPSELVTPPGDGEPDWLAMVGRHIALTAFPGEPPPRICVHDARAHVQLHNRGEIIVKRGVAYAREVWQAEVYGPDGQPPGERQATLIVPRPFTATEMWTLCVLVGLLPDRSRDA